MTHRSFGRDVAQSGSVPEWGSGGPGFKSRRPDQFFPFRIKSLPHRMIPLQEGVVRNLYAIPAMARGKQGKLHPGRGRALAECVGEVMLCRAGPRHRRCNGPEVEWRSVSAGGARGVLSGRSWSPTEEFPRNALRQPSAVGRYCQELWTASDQAASFRSMKSSSACRSCCTPFSNFTPALTRGSRWAALSRRHRCWAMSRSL